MKPDFPWRPVFWLLLSTVLLPAAGTVSIGILILVFYQEGWDVASGVLVICFSVFALVGCFIAFFLFRRHSLLARIQSDFISRMSHDFRTPLTSIKLFVDTLHAGKASPQEEQRCLDYLQQEMARMERLIEHVLDWRHLETKGITRTRRTEMPEEITRAALSPYLSGLDREAAGRIELELEDDLPKIDVERDSVVDALRNLVQNGLNHSAGMVTVTVRRGRCGAIEFLVRDNGTPIPRRERRRIFRKFYRSKERGDGSGLGLPIARRVASNHGGRLDLHVCKAGNVFSLLLPGDGEKRRWRGPKSAARPRPKKAAGESRQRR